MFLRDYLVIVGCVHILLAGLSTAKSCYFSINSTLVNPSCLSVSIYDDDSSPSCRCKLTIQETNTCGSKKAPNCNTCCQHWPQKCSSYDMYLYEIGQSLYMIIGKLYYGVEFVVDVSCSLNRTVGLLQSSTVRPSSPTLSSTATGPGIPGQSDSMSSTTPTFYMYNFDPDMPQDMETNPEDNNQKNVVIGSVVGVVGGLILIAVIVAVVFYRRRRKPSSNFSNGQRNENDYFEGEQSVNSPPFNPNMEPNSYDNNCPIAAPTMSHVDTNETTVIDNQFYACNPSETATKATDHEADDTTLVENQFYAGNPSETVTVDTDNTTGVDYSFCGRNPVKTTSTGYDNVGRKS